MSLSIHNAAKSSIEKLKHNPYTWKLRSGTNINNIWGKTVVIADIKHKTYIFKS
jgi:hypothetical protein